MRLSTSRRLFPLLAFTAISSIGFILPASAQSQQAAAPTVTGVQGCVMKGDTSTWNGNRQDAYGAPIGCQAPPNQGGDTLNGYQYTTYGNFATVGSVNTALSNLQNQINAIEGGGSGLQKVATDGVTIVGDGTSGNPVKLADGIKNQIDTNTVNIANLNTRLGNDETVINSNTNRITNVEGAIVNHETRITNVEGAVTNLQTTVNNHETRITNLETTVDDHSQWINNVNNGGGIKYFHANSTAPDAQASGTNSVAVGGAAVSSAANTVAVGEGAIAANTNSVALGAGSVTDRDNSVSVGNGNLSRQITHVAAGTVDTDAVNVAQLKAIATNLGGGSTVDQNGNVTAPTYVVNNQTYTTVSSAVTALDTLSVKYDDSSRRSVTLNAGNGPVTIHNVAAGVAPTDAVNRSQLDAVKDGAVNYDRNKDGTKGQSVTLIGGNRRAPVSIRNVADGVKAHDAVNVRQLRAAMTTYVDPVRDYTDQKFNMLTQELGDVRREARTAAAVGIATSSLRFDNKPGKFSVAAGSGVWKGQAAFAMGAGYTTEDGIARFNVSTTTADGEWGVGGGMSFTLN